jgi:hypothetical protein
MTKFEYLNQALKREFLRSDASSGVRILSHVPEDLQIKVLVIVMLGF